MNDRKYWEAIATGDMEAIQKYHDEAMQELGYYEATHDMQLQHEAIRPFIDVIQSLNPDDENYNELLREQFKQMEAYRKEHKEALEVITSLEEGRPGTRLYEFCDTLTRDDFRDIAGLDLSDTDWEAFEADRVYYFLGLYVTTCIALYEGKQTHYRTRAKAREAAPIVEVMPGTLATITLNDYRHALDFYRAGKAYLVKYRNVDTLKFKDGKLYFPELKAPGSPPRLKELGEVELQNIETKEGITEIDLPLLRLYYSIMLYEYQKNYSIRDLDRITIYVGDLAELIGMKSFPKPEEIENMVAKLQKFHTITGKIKVRFGGKERFSYYQVLNFEYYDATTNMISFSSPYMQKVLYEVYEAAKRRDRDGKPKLKKTGVPMFQPNHSYLALPTLAKERNKAAVENVHIILAVIETSGKSLPHIKAETIIERNVQLSERLKGQDTRHANTLLKRCFQKTWELLATQTRLREKYLNIELPDPNNPGSIPTMSTLDMLFEFKHDGKIVK